MKIQEKIRNGAMATTLAVSMIIGSAGTACASNIADVDNHWASTQINRLVDMGLVSGYKDGTFRPNNDITRAEFISLMNKAYGFSAVYEIDYKDVSSKDWFYEDIRRAKAQGYIAGYQDNTMRPNNKITRQEVAVIMTKIFGMQSTDKASIADKFTDKNKIAAWAKESVGVMVNYGHMNGYPDGTFAPDKFITRAEAITIIDKIFNKVSSKSNYTLEKAKSSSSSSSSNDKTVESGDVKITKKGYTLKNQEIKGDLIISEDVDDGNVYLENVTVKGTTKIYGGGENSVYIEDCDLGNVTVDKKDDKIRLVAKGNTNIGKVELKSGAKLEESNLKKAGFESILLAEDIKDTRVSFKGNFDSIEVKSNKADIRLEEGKVYKLEITDKAKDTKLDIARDVNLNRLYVDSKMDVTGKGNIDTANVNSSDVTFEKKPGSIDGSKKSSAKIHDSSTNQDQAAPTVIAGIGKITGTTTAIEYKLSSAADSTYKACANTETIVGVGEYVVRYAAKSGYNAGTTKTVKVVANQEQSAPTITAGIGKIIGTTTAMEYKLGTAADSTYKACTNTETIIGVGEYVVRYAAKVGYNAGSTKAITVAANQEQVAPTVIAGIGKITGTTTSMEYKLGTASDSTYKVCTNTETIVGVGEYVVRYAAKVGYNAGAPKTVTVAVNQEQVAPTVVAGIGKITGTTTAMEYKLGTAVDSAYVACTNTETIVPAGEYVVRYAARVGYNAGTPKAVNVANQEQAAPMITAGIGKITGTTIAMEYKLLAAADSTYVACTNTETIVPAGEYVVRYAARVGYNAGTPKAVTVAKQEQAAPTITAGIGKIIGTTTAMEYKLSTAADSTYVACTNTETIVGVGAYVVRYAAKAGYNAGTPKAVTVVANQEQAAPTVVAGIGKMTGTTTAMEYKLSTAADSTYVACTNTETTVPPGEYCVRYTAKLGYNAGHTIMVKVN